QKARTPVISLDDIRGFFSVKGKYLLWKLTALDALTRIWLISCRRLDKLRRIITLQNRGTCGQTRSKPISLCRRISMGATRLVGALPCDPGRGLLRGTCPSYCTCIPGTRGVTSGDAATSGPQVPSELGDAGRKKLRHSRRRDHWISLPAELVRPEPHRSQ